MRSILCFNTKPCPFRGILRGHEDLSKSVNPSAPPYYSCNATSIEQMQPCLLEEDKDLKRHGIKVLVKDSSEHKTKAWNPEKLLIFRTDRDEAIYGPDLVDDKIEV